MPVVADLPGFAGSLRGVCLALALLATLAMICRFGRLRGSTLVFAWWWTLAAVWVPICGELLLAWGWGEDPRWAEPLRFAAAAMVFCPVMAVLGAKRPHHRAWQFIVASLWVVLILPAGEKFFLQRGQALQMTEARKWFLVALIFVSTSNYLTTRFWLAGFLGGLSQVAFFSRYLPLVSASWGPASAQFVGIGLLSAAILVAALTPLRHRGSEAVGEKEWLKFRDAFGTLWGLRIIERMNAVAVQQEWPYRLTWWGWRDSEGGHLTELPLEQREVLEQAFRNLMRRFVDEQ